MSWRAGTVESFMTTQTPKSDPWVKLSDGTRMRASLIHSVGIDRDKYRLFLKGKGNEIVAVAQYETIDQLEEALDIVDAVLDAVG